MYKCNVYPIFTEEELAKLMWFKNEELSGKYIAKRVSKDGFLVLPPEYSNKDKLSLKELTNSQCVFYKDGECAIKEYMPSFCKVDKVDSKELNILRLDAYLDKTSEFKLSNLNKIREIKDYSDPKVIRKYNKHLKEDLIHFFMLGYIDKLLGDPEDNEDKIKIADGLYVSSRYYLYKQKKKNNGGYLIRPIRMKYLVTDKSEYIYIVEYINMVIKRFHYYPHGYIKFLETKLSNLLKGVSFKPDGIDLSDIEDVFFSVALMSNLYKRKYLNKNKWKGFANDDVIYNYMKYYLAKKTGEEYSYKLFTHPKVVNKIKNVEMVFQSIMKNK